jgi:hypothetical protein
VALKPWHLIALLCCMVVATGVVAGIVLIVRLAGRSKQ